MRLAAAGLSMCLALAACGDSKKAESPRSVQVQPLQSTEIIPTKLQAQNVEAPVADYLDNGMYWFPGATINALKYAAPSASCTARGSLTTCLVEPTVPDAWCMGMSPCTSATFKFQDDRLVASSVEVSETKLTGLVDQTIASCGRARTRIVDEPRLPIQSVHFAWKMGSKYLEMVQIGGIDRNGLPYRSQLVSIGPNPPVGIDFSAARPVAQNSVTISPARGQIVLNPFKSNSEETSKPSSEIAASENDGAKTDASETPQ